MTRTCTLLVTVALSSLLLTAHSQPTSDDTVVAVDWHLRESTSLHKKIDAAIIKYAEALSNSAYSETGGRTLQALGLLAALPRLPESLRKDYLAKAIGVVEAERKDFWPGDDKDATDRAAKLHSSASYHLPMILLLLEHQQAGALQAGEGTTRDREMRFGILPAKPLRRDVVRLLSLLLAAGYGKSDGYPNAFDAIMHDGRIWSYSSFGRKDAPDNSCISPTGMAAIGLSAAVFGLNVLEYDDDDYDIKFGGQQLHRKDIRDRLVDVCAHLIFSLVRHNQYKDLAGMTVDASHMDADVFREISAPNQSGQMLVRVQAQKADLEANKGKLSIYHYRANSPAKDGAPHRGAYYSACAAYTLPTATRVLALALEREAKGTTSVGKQYPFTRESDGKWRLSAAGGWTVETVQEGAGRYSPLRFSQSGTILPIDGTIAGALNTCVACATVPSGTDHQQRRLRGYDDKNPKLWLRGSSSEESHVEQFAALHAFALYKAAVVTGDGYTIGRWLVWQDLAEGLARDDFIEPQVKAASGNDRKAAALAFAIITMTRTYRPIFPKSDVPAK